MDQMRQRESGFQIYGNHNPVLSPKRRFQFRYSRQVSFICLDVVHCQSFSWFALVLVFTFVQVDGSGWDSAHVCLARCPSLDGMYHIFTAASALHADCANSPVYI